MAEYEPSLPIARLLGNGHVPLRVSSVAPSAEMSSAIKRIIVKWPPPLMPATEGRRELLRRIAGCIEAWEWSNIDMAQMREAVRYCFLPPFLQEAEFDALRAFFLREVAYSDNESVLSACADSYLESFGERAEHTRALAAALRESLRAPLLRRNGNGLRCLLSARSS